MLSTSTRPAVPDADVDQGNALLKKMSDSSRAPVTVSTMKLVAASTRSRSGADRNPSVLMPSPSPGPAEVKPANWYDTAAVGTFAQLENARPTAAWNSDALTPDTLWSFM